MRKANSLTLDEIEYHIRDRFQDDGFLTLKNLPHPHRFKDMERATQRIVQALESGEQIVVIGDYDVAWGYLHNCSNPFFQGDRGRYRVDNSRPFQRWIWTLQSYC